MENWHSRVGNWVDFEQISKPWFFSPHMQYLSDFRPSLTSGQSGGAQKGGGEGESEDESFSA